MTDGSDVELARDRIERAKRDKGAAREIINQAAVAIRDVTGGRLPDAERREYLIYVLECLEKILDGEAADKALGLWTDHRAKSVNKADRNFKLFLAVGLEYQRTGNVGNAQRNVSRRTKLGISVVRLAWESLGGLPSWQAAIAYAESAE